MNQYAKIKNGKVENIIVSKNHPEPIDEYVYVYDNSSLIEIGYGYTASEGFTPFKGSIISESDLRKTLYGVDTVEGLERAKIIAKTWRNKKLAETDWIVQTTDHPQIESYKIYRQKLRDWPTTQDFPLTIPQL